MQVHCISVSEHIWVGGGGPRGVGELPAGGICASQGTFSSFFLWNSSIYLFVAQHRMVELLY